MWTKHNLNAQTYRQTLILPLGRCLEESSTLWTNEATDGNRNREMDVQTNVHSHTRKSINEIDITKLSVYYVCCCAGNNVVVIAVTMLFEKWPAYQCALLKTTT